MTFRRKLGKTFSLTCVFARYSVGEKNGERMKNGP